MLSDKEQKEEFCNATDHRWKEEYYGYECENCGLLIPYGCEPWAYDEDDYIPMEYLPEQEYPF